MLQRMGKKSIIVSSTDTDVFVLLVYYWRELNVEGLEELWMKGGVGETTRYIPIHILTKKVGMNLCKVLPAIHALSGCDYTSKVGTKHSALLVNPEMYLKDLGILNHNVDSLFDKAEAYLTQVLKKGTTFKTLDQLRFHKYHHAKRASLEDLPPTSYSIRLHIKRAYLATYEMISIFTSQASLDPRQFGFELNDELLIPSNGRNPIPEDFAIHCTCSKCGTQRCLCRKSGVQCCKFCSCQSVVLGTYLESLCKNIFHSN